MATGFCLKNANTKWHNAMSNMRCIFCGASSIKFKLGLHLSNDLGLYLCKGAQIQFRRRMMTSNTLGCSKRRESSMPALSKFSRRYASSHQSHQHHDWPVETVVNLSWDMPKFLKRTHSDQTPHQYLKRQKLGKGPGSKPCLHSRSCL